jgi:hypothetical protein
MLHPQYSHLLELDCIRKLSIKKVPDHLPIKGSGRSSTAPTAAIQSLRNQFAQLIHDLKALEDKLRNTE